MAPCAREPDQARDRVDQRQRHQVVDRLGMVLDPPQPVGNLGRAIAQVVRSASHSLLEHGQGHGKVVEIGRRRVRDLLVIAQQIAFGHPRRWPVALLQVRDLDRLASSLTCFRGGTHTDGLLALVLAVAVLTALTVLRGPASYQAS
jgi:hypothetical protein